MCASLHVKAGVLPSHACCYCTWLHSCMHSMFSCCYTGGNTLTLPLPKPLLFLSSVQHPPPPIYQAEEHLGGGFPFLMRHIPRSPTPLPQSPRQGLSESNTNHTHIHAHTHTHTHTPTYTHTHTHTREASCYVSIYTVASHTHIHTYTHTHTHTHIHTHTHRRAHTHTCMLPTLHEEGHTCCRLRLPQRCFPSRSRYGRPNDMQPIYK